MENQDISVRKTDHIDLAFKSQANGHDSRFDYEPILAGHPLKGAIPPVHFAGKQLLAPIWISSMTGGANHAAVINRNLAKVCKEFGLGMGLGSCRALLEDDRYLSDFDVRSAIGDQPLFANLGIAQVEEIVLNEKFQLIDNLIQRLEADGLIVHVNPLQEWLQPEGDTIKSAPIQIITEFLNNFKIPMIVKEVGQGFGPESLKQLSALPLEAIDFGAHGGTNFSLLENQRSKDFLKNEFEVISHIGHTAEEMTEMTRRLIVEAGNTIKTRGFIVSGGIQNFLDGYYHISRIPYKAIYGQASAFLAYAVKGEYEVLKYAESQIRGLEMANQFLRIKDQT